MSVSDDNAPPALHDCAMTITAGGWLAERTRVTWMDDLEVLITALNELFTADWLPVEDDSSYSAILKAIEGYDSVPRTIGLFS